LVSALLRPAPPPKDSGRVALAAALAACRAVESAVPGARAPSPQGLRSPPKLASEGGRVEIQWPNDLLLGGRKLGGILIESRRGAAALGLGLNVAQRPGDFPPELRDRATSLAAAGAAADRRALLAALLAELGRAFGSSGISEEAWGELRAEVEARLAWRGREVRVAGCPQGPLAGKLVGLDESGGLVLESAGGARRAAATGSLELA